VGSEGWLRKNWTTPVILLVIFLLALYLRTFFSWDLAVDDRLLSGGSDSFYYERIVNYCVETGKQLTFDPRLNFPMGLTNPRPPLYSWTTCVTGKALAPFTGDVWQSVTIVFLASTAVWGALTVFPTYFLTKEAFGRRAAILAAFFLAILPAHLQRSPATNADHDAMVLFFVVTGFFFFLRSLKSLNERRWVDDWSFWTKEGRASIRKGIGDALRENRRSTLYALMAGWCLAAVALIWQGWAYAPIILLVYFLLQILVHRFRNQDPMGIVAMFAITLGLPLLVAFPWYFQMGQVAVWYDVPFYLFVVAMGLGIVFTVTRDYPWALVIPIVVTVGGVALFVASLFYPSIANAFVSGAGYFVRTKAYETIAEAQPPGISQVILSFGIATYFLALFGLVWMMRGIPKHPTPDYLFVVVWAVAAIFMANAAARFIFNASPAFVMTSAWVTILLLEWLRFDDMKKTFRSLAAGGRLSALRRSVKIRHVAGSLLVIFILILPNVWFGVDAAIPFERKFQYDREVCNAYPDFLRPEGCAQVSQGGSFVFGAFGYSLPLKTEYFPAAWAWFREQDADIHPVENRPAFLSWWDYGFEAVDVGAHPTVADNFLDGYHLAGSFITAQGQDEGIALLDMRLLEGDFRANGKRFGDAAKATLEGLGVPWQRIEDGFRNPAAYVQTIEDNPSVYGRYQDVQAANAQYIYGRQILTDALDTDGLVALNHALREIVGASIRYFTVDTRLFPVDGQNTGIFYAPAKLSDHRILELQDGRSIPLDFFEIFANTQRGTVNLRDVKPEDSVTALTLRYKEMFYNSMFYRAYIGFSPAVAGQNCNDCIPGMPSSTNQQIGQIQPMQAWNLSHFRVVYKTAYYNPFPPAEIANHTDAWQAMNYEDAQDLQGKINRGEAQGVVDLSAQALIRRGIVVVKYYDGAFLNGTVRIDGTPWSGVRVTVHDEFGIPHDTAVTDADGRYSVLLPFGKIHVQTTLGTPDNRTLAGPTTLNSFEIDVSDAASMREDVDADRDGIVDWKVQRDIDVDGETIDGTLFLDVNRDGTRGLTEPVLEDAAVSLSSPGAGITRSARTSSDGHLFVEGLYAGTYDATITWRGRSLVVANVTVAQNQPAKDFAVRPAILQGNVLDAAGRKVGSASVSVLDRTNGTTLRATAASDGFFAFQSLLPGAYDITASEGARVSMPDRAWIVNGTDTVRQNVTVYPAATVQVQSALGGGPQGYVTLSFLQRGGANLVRVVTTDALGRATISLPSGAWDVHARHYSDGRLWAILDALTVTSGETVPYTANLGPGAVVTGVIYEKGNRTNALGQGDIFFRNADAQLRVRADSDGRFLAELPVDAYTIQIAYLDFWVYEVRTISATTGLNVEAVRGARIQASAFRQFPANETVQIQDPVRDATVEFFDATRTFRTTTATDGTFDLALPSDGRFALRILLPGYEPFERAALGSFEWQGNNRFFLTARDIPVSGTVRIDGNPFGDATLGITFRAVGAGAVTEVGSPDATGRYAIALSPGRYEVEVDRDQSGDGAVRLQLRDETALSLAVGDAPLALDLPLATRVRVDGTVTLSGQPRTAVVHFDGPDVRNTNATDGQYATFLIPGSYTVSANVTSGTNAWMALQRVLISTPTTLNLALVQATNVTGTVRFDDAPLGGVPITFTGSGGESVSATSTSFGSYSLFLLGGTYEARVDHPTTATENGVTRYVRYAYAATVTVDPSRLFKIQDIDLSRSLENTTVSGIVRFRGAPVAAQLTFLEKGSGMNATASAASDGRYSLAMQPGSYDVYVLAPLERGAFLWTFDLAAGSPRTFDLTLVDAVEVVGVTTRGPSRIAANLTFTSPVGRMALRTDPSGNYHVFLPAATYTAQATARGVERTINVTYRADASLPLSSPTVLNLALTKVVVRRVDATWDSAQRALVSPGDTVDYFVVVKNTGNEDDTIALSASSSDFTFTFSDDRLSIPFGQTNERTVKVTITAKADARVEHSPASITARSEADSTAVKSVTVEIDVEKQPGVVSASVSSTAPTWDGKYLNYSLDVRNAGNGAETFRLSLTNEDELLAAGWRPALVSPIGTAQATLDLSLAANQTLKPTLRLERVGLGAPIRASVRVENTADAQYQTVVTVNVQMPTLIVEGSIRAGGTGITLQEPGIDLATGAFLVSLLAVVAAAAYLWVLRRRSR